MSLFDATEVSETGIEPGEYVIFVDHAEVKETKSGTGEYINIRWKLEDQGDTFYSLYNIKNPNEKAVQIGLSELKRMCAAAGVEAKVSSVDELNGLRVKARLAEKEDDYGIKTVIKKYMKAEAAQAF